MDKIYRVKMGMGGRYALERDGGLYWLEGNPFTDYHTGMLIEDTPVRFTAPVTPTKIMAIGLNYKDHAAEMNKKLPDEPLVFSKPATSVVGPDEPIRIPQWAGRIDHEAEMAVVIGRRAYQVKADRAMDYVLGITCLNDVTARDLQQQHMQWFKGKSLDSFCPMGPFVVTADEYGDPQSKQVQTRVNGAVKQDASTSKMIFPVDSIIEWLSKGLTLEAGDIIATGTPEGVGMGRTPQEFLADGDVLETEVEGIGTLRNRIRDVK